MVGSAHASRWPASVRRRDGRVVPFDAARIEAAIARAAREASRGDRRRRPRHLPGRVEG
ncbi:ATP cone domain-containing protein [Mycobacterium saskatchewanense]|uniref:ATP cone domain-containing protein n=1 Tax=Mycobacterium saskatchewanense TaxID=220927 RepID=UPI000A14EEAD